MYYDRFSLRRTVFPQNGPISHTYFNELVLGFSSDRNQITAEIFSYPEYKELSKKVEIWFLHETVCQLAPMLTLAKCYLKYISWTEWDIFTKLGTHVMQSWKIKKKKVLFFMMKSSSVERDEFSVVAWRLTGIQHSGWGWEDHSTSQEWWTRMFWRVILSLSVMVPRGVAH